MNKVCSKCLIEKDVGEFYKNSCRCKICIRQYQIDNKDRIQKYQKEYDKNYYAIHREKIQKYQKKYNINNKEKVLERKIKYYQMHKEQSRTYFLKNKDKIYKRDNVWRANERKTNASFKLRQNLSNRINNALKRNSKITNTVNLLGCSIFDLKQHLQKQFKEGMTWDNYGLRGWHVDHIKPCSSFDLTKLEEQQKCFHYSNLQPLWARENLEKGDKICVS